jgi:PAS domain S-box-containing protein
MPRRRVRITWRSIAYFCRMAQSAGSWRGDAVTGMLQVILGVVFDITERRKSEEALRRQWHTFDTALSHTPDFTYIFDLEGRFTYVNRALLSLWQKTLAEAVGKNFFDLGYPPWLAERLQRQIQQVVETGATLRDHTPFTGPTGETRHYEYIFVPVFSEAGRLEAVAGSTRDITERRQAEEALRRREEAQALMIELLQGQRETTDPEAMMRAAAEALGHHLKTDRLGFFEVREDETLDFLVGWTNGRLPLLTSAFSAAGIGTRYLSEIRAGKTIGISDATTDPLTADSLFPAIGTVALIGVPVIRYGRWHAGFYVNHAEVRAWTPEEVSLVRDVGQQTWDAVERARTQVALRKSEEQLRIERERLAQIFEQAPVAIAVFRGHDFVVEMANPSYQALLRKRNLAGRHFAEIVPELGSHVWEAFQRVVETGQPFVASEFHVSYDQEGEGIVDDHWFNVVYHPLRETDGLVSGMVAVCSEVTAQVRARQELERINRDLEEFAYVSSHDLQEPLRMVNIYTQLLVRRFLGDNPDAQVYAGIVREGVMRMDTLLRDLLTYSRTVHRDDSPAGTADLTVSLAEALAVLQNRIQESGALVTTTSLPIVRGDSSQFAHVFQNLLSNALKYSNKNVPPEIRISTESDRDQWVICVRDNGIGFEPQYAERIFGLFKRLHKEEYPGTGLGLAICQRIVERYGGRMWAEGRPGEGATFWFSLPRGRNELPDGADEIEAP